MFDYIFLFALVVNESGLDDGFCMFRSHRGTSRKNFIKAQKSSTSVFTLEGFSGFTETNVKSPCVDYGEAQLSQLSACECQKRWRKKIFVS